MAIDEKGIPTVVNRFGATTLVSSINQNSTSCTLTDASGLADGNIGGTIQIEDEIIYFESRSGNVLSGLRRGQDGSTAASHDSGSTVTSQIVAGNFNSLKQSVLDLDDAKYELPAGGTADQFLDGTGSLQDIPAYQDADTLIIEVVNDDTVALPKGTVVYISGASGSKPLVKRASAASETESAKTIGLMRNDTGIGAAGVVVLQGSIDAIDMRNYPAGSELWLSVTPGAFTLDKPQSPNHLVQVGFSIRPDQNGVLEVRIDNGYEIEELHDVLVTNVQANQVLSWNGTDLWVNKTLQISDTSGLQTALDGKVDENAPITGATHTKITYDSKGLVTAGANATTTDIAEGTRLYFTDQRAKDAVISQTITNGVTTFSPSEDAVFDALALKANAADVYTKTELDAGQLDNRYYTETEIDSKLSLKYDASNPDSYIPLTALSVGTPAAPSGSGSLAYDNSTGVFTFTPPDLSPYLTAEVNDLTAAVTWATVPDAYISSSSVTQHEGDISITASQVSDFDTEVAANAAVVANTAKRSYPLADEQKLAGIEPLAEVNNISDTDATDLTDGGDSALHFHSSDRNRANHTGTQTASTISDFDTEVSNNASVVANTAKRSYPLADEQKLLGIEPGAEVNNISDTDATDLTDGGDSSLHFHSADRDRANHTGTQTAATISDFDTEVANNSAVAANTAKVSADGSIDTHSDVDTTTSSPTTGQALVWNGTTWVPDDVVVDPAGADTQIQFNNAGVFGASANLTFDGTLNVKGSGTTDATSTLALTNSSDVNLFTMKDDGTFNGKSIAIGEYAAATRIGENAAPSATGSFWTAIGSNAGKSSTEGSSWTAIGFSAGFSSTTGSSWTAIGPNAGFSSTTGSSWVAIGPNAGRSNTTYSSWLAIGRDAARNNTTGDSWIAIGRDAGRYITGTTTALEYFQNSTYIGTFTKGTNGTSTALTNNETVIGYAAEGNGSNTVTIGSSAVTDNYFSGSINAKGKGTTSATNTLALTNSSDDSLFVVKDNGNIAGTNIGIGDFSAVRIGINAALNATGTNWTAIGTAAGRDNLTGNNWTAIGRSAGVSNTGGNSWTAIGYRAGESNLTGNNWTAIGPSAARSNTSSSWVAIGTEAGLSSTTGDNWTAIGISAGRSNTTGSAWVAIGLDAGRYIKNTSDALEYFQNSTYIGTDTKGTNGTSSALTDNETVIGYAAEGNGSNTVTIGSSAVTGNFFRGSVNAKGKGTTSATTTLALTNSSDDNLFTMRDDGTFAGKNLAIGEYTGAMRIGEDAGVSATGANWAALGFKAGFSNTTGDAWTAIGYQAGLNNAGGDNWTAIGYNAGRENTTGVNWTAVGYNAGFNNTTGSFWTALGLNAGLSNTAGSFWTALGLNSGLNNTTGSSWVAIGQNAGRYIKGGTAALQYFENSTYIGTSTKGTNGTSTVLTNNETVIGYQAEGNGSNTVTIGSSAVTDNYFNGKLHVTSSAQVGDDSDAASAANVGAIRYRADANNSYMDMVMQTGASTYAWVNIKTNTW